MKPNVGLRIIIIANRAAVAITYKKTIFKKWVNSKKGNTSRAMTTPTSAKSAVLAKWTKKCHTVFSCDPSRPGKSVGMYVAKYTPMKHSARTPEVSIHTSATKKQT